MELKQNVSIHNKFEIEVIRNGEVVQKAVGYNKILNQFWTRFFSNLGNGGKYFYYIFYGSGTGTPSVTDTSLFHHEGAVVATQTASGQDLVNNGIAWVTKKIELNEQTAVGVELSEVGIGWGSSASNLCTHAMLEDMNGNPITIEKTDVDIINIYATVYVHFGLKKWTPYLLAGAISNIDRSYCSLYHWIFGVPADPTYTGNALGLGVGKIAIISLGRPSNLNKMQNFRSPYRVKFSSESEFITDVANKRVTVKAGRFAVAEANVDGGIAFIWMGGSEGTQTDRYMTPALFIPVEGFLPGTDITNEAVGTGDGVETEFSTKYDFPTNAKIYINGVQTTGYTIAEVPASTLGAQYYALPIAKESTLARLIPSREPLVANSSGDSVYFGIYTSYLIYNRAYGVGINKITKSTGHGVVYGSNDLENWTILADLADTTVNLTGANQHYKYFKFEADADNYGASLWVNENTGKNIIFNNPPANGAVITADYHTPYIAKDSDHVLDVTVVYQFGEYTE